MQERIIYDNAIQIPVSGPTFKKVNISCMEYTAQILLNLQKNDDSSDDEPYFLSLNDARDLVFEIQKAIYKVEKGEKS